MLGIQTTFKLEVPERAADDERLKAVIDLVVDRFGGDLMAYYNAIRPKPRALNVDEERISLFASRLAKRL